MITLRLLAQKARTPSHAVSGFTLPEVLVASLIAAAFVVITAQVMINQLLEERRLEVAQRLREDVSRLNYLIQIEASEAEEIAYAGANPVGSICPARDAESFMFLVPRPTGTYADDSTRSRVQYYNANDQGIPAIWRCGPPVTRNGVLRHNEANVAGIVMRNAQLDLDPTSTVRGVTYQVTPTAGLLGGNLGDLGDPATAHARSVFVCNPPVGAGGAVGDCPP